MKILKNFMLAFLLIFVASYQAFAKANIEDDSKYLPCTEFTESDKVACSLVFMGPFLEKYTQSRKFLAKEEVFQKWDILLDRPLKYLKQDIDNNMAFISILNLVDNIVGMKPVMTYLSGKESLTEAEFEASMRSLNPVIESVVASLIGQHNALFTKTKGENYILEKRLYTDQDFDKAYAFLKKLKYRNKDVYTILNYTSNAHKYMMLSYKDPNILDGLDQFSKSYTKQNSVYTFSLFSVSIYESMLKNVKEVEPTDGIYYIFAEKKLEQVDFMKKEINRKIAAK
jgi:hypothetical protein